MRKAWGFGAAFASAMVLAGCGTAASHQTSLKPASGPSSAAASLPAASGNVYSYGGSVPSTAAGGVADPQMPIGPLTSVSHRDAGPVTLRLFTTPPMPTPTCDPATTQCVPQWCQVTSQLALELSTDAIAAREITSDIGVAPGGHLSLLYDVTEGTAEGAPLQAVLARAADDVDHVQLSTGGNTDSASPVKGLLALAVSGAQQSGTLTAYDGSGKVLQQIQLPTTLTQASAACMPQPLKLPSPGVQPADRAAAVEQVRAAFSNAFTHAPAGGDIYHALATVQDSAGLRSAIDQVQKNFPVAFNTITVTTGDIVFTDPTHAVIQFTPTYEQGAPYGTQNGRAVLEGGKWLVTQDTYCGLLRWGGATCP